MVISLRCAVATVVFVLGISLLNAQDNVPGTYADPHNPAGPPGPAQETQIWKVDPITGYLSIDIPILNVSAPGRGPKVPYSLRYNSAATVQLSTSIVPPDVYEPPTVNGFQLYEWTGGAPNTGGLPTPWSENLRQFTWSSTSIPDDTTSDLSGCSVFGPYILSDENGSHDLGVGYATQGEVNGCGTNSPPTTSFSTDGSAIKTEINPLSMTYPDGTQITCPQFGQSACSLEDSNGRVAHIRIWGAPYLEECSVP